MTISIDTFIFCVRTHTKHARKSPKMLLKQEKNEIQNITEILGIHALFSLLMNLANNKASSLIKVSIVCLPPILTRAHFRLFNEEREKDFFYCRRYKNEFPLWVCRFCKSYTQRSRKTHMNVLSNQLYCKFRKVLHVRDKIRSRRQREWLPRNT